MATLELSLQNTFHHNKKENRPQWLRRSAGPVKVLVFASSELLRHPFTQALQILEPFVTAHARVVLGALSLIDCVGMGCDCHGQQPPIRSGI
jgi:hypothetical protein